MPVSPLIAVRRTAVAMALLLTSTVIGGSGPVLAGAPACSVLNVRTEVTAGNLGAAIGDASAGDTLRLGGSCLGGVEIDRNLKIIGDWATSRPTIRGDGSAPVVTVNTGVTVTMRGLVIRGGDGGAGEGGGVRNLGTLTLIDMVVRGNAAYHGGGIGNSQGRLTLKGSTSVRDNTATNGGGISSLYGVLTVSESVRIEDNDAADRGGGLHLVAGTTTIGGTARVFRNRASLAGGIDLLGPGTLTLKDSALVDANMGEFGSGMFVQATGPQASRLFLQGRATVGPNTLRGGPGAAVTLASGNAAATMQMSGSATVRGQDSRSHPLSAAVLLLSNGPVASLTMKGTSTITNNRLGPGWAGVVRWNSCPGATTKVVGATAARVKNNTPANRKTDTTTACP